MLQEPIFTVLHFNDVYDIQERNGHGGIVNFKAKLQALKQQWPNSLVLFSGDAFSPSILSTIKQGYQMLECLNQLEIDAACYGNHEFDYPHDHLVDLKNKSNFPWLMGNLTYLPTGKNLGEGKDFVVVKKFGMNIGIFGIAGEDWPGVLPSMYYKKVQYKDHVEYSNNMCKLLREQHQCNFIIALTHMRNGPDCLYPSHVKDVDLVLGGHDHLILKQFINSVPVIKSGTNFYNLGVINIYKPYITGDKISIGRRFNFNYDVLDVPIAPADKIDRELKNYVHQLFEEYKKHDKIVGYTEVDLDMTFGFHRRNQSTYGNFLADLYRLYVDCDIAFANAGNVRSDCVLEKGELWFSDVKNIIQDTLIVKELTGKQILKALELSIDSLPLGTKGSFLQVSGIRFTYSLKRPPGSRLMNIWIDSKPIKLKKTYSVVMISYIAKGGDNYTFLKQCPVLKDETQTIVTVNLVKLFFQNLNYDLIPEEERGNVEIKPQTDAVKRIVQLQSGVRRSDDGVLIPMICPKIEGRIVDVSDLDDFGSYKFLRDSDNSINNRLSRHEEEEQMQNQDKDQIQNQDYDQEVGYEEDLQMEKYMDHEMQYQEDERFDEI